jgi:hypothetical protein
VAPRRGKAGGARLASLRQNLRPIGEKSAADESATRAQEIHTLGASTQQNKAERLGRLDDFPLTYFV